jgi:hypothetical protein
MVGILLGEGWELYIVIDGVMVGILLVEGWELYFVTDGVMVGILPGEGSHCEKRPSFSAFHDTGHLLSMFILDSLMMAF